MRDPAPVTVVIPVKNEAQDLAACLARLHRFAMVVVVDSDSTDATCRIASDAGAEVLRFHWDGRFPKKRNWVLRTHRFTTPWVLFLDADELVDDDFVDELARELLVSHHAGYWITYHNWFLGRRLVHGPRNRKLALLRVGSGEYERIDEEAWSSLDMEVHEHPIVDGTVGRIHTPVDHRDNRGYEHWLARHNAYSSWEARRIQRLRDAARSGNAKLTIKQKVKYFAMGRFWLPLAYFLYAYVGKLGILDGYPGFVHAASKAVYFWQIGVKLRELRSRA
jgi:glycosyltransferase involved in cell wall biosynthesis